MGAIVEAIKKPEPCKTEDEGRSLQYIALVHLVTGAAAIAREGEHGEGMCMSCWAVNELLDAFLEGMENYELADKPAAKPNGKKNGKRKAA
jgi:hypothetical protein